MDNKVKVTVECELGGKSVKKVIETDFAICMVDSERDGEPVLQTMILGKTKPLNLIAAAAQLQNNIKEAVTKSLLEKREAKVSDGLGDILDALMEVLK